MDVANGGIEYQDVHARRYQRDWLKDRIDTWADGCTLVSKVNDMYRIEILSGKRYHDSTEGPWDCYEDALRFAQSEVGLPWRILEWIDDRINPNNSHWHVITKGGTPSR